MFYKTFSSNFALMYKALALVVILLSGESVSGQKLFNPSWVKGDTLRYFISQSALIDESRISLNTYETQIVVQAAENNQFYLAIRLFINASPNQEPHWSLFYNELKTVSFYFQFHPDSVNGLSKPIQTEKSLGELNQALQRFINYEWVQPKAYFEVVDWLKQLNELNGIPQVLGEYLNVLNSVFNCYSSNSVSANGRQTKTELIPCGTQPVQLNWAIADTTIRADPDSLIRKQTRSLNTNNKHQTYIDLNRCGKLLGLEDILQFDAYELMQQETWVAPANGKLFYRYTFDQEIRIQMEEAQSWQRVQTHIVGLNY
jgi:hypothetical protein